MGRLCVLDHQHHEGLGSAYSQNQLLLAVYLDVDVCRFPDALFMSLVVYS